jgi:hypothetical protein
MKNFRVMTKICPTLIEITQPSYYKTQSSAQDNESVGCLYCKHEIFVNIKIIIAILNTVVDAIKFIADAIIYSET